MTLSYIAGTDSVTESVMESVFSLRVLRIVIKGRYRPLLQITALVGQLPPETVQYSHYELKKIHA